MPSGSYDNSIFSGLNPEQQKAVECVQGPSLILAGAGSGKTRVLTVRMAHLVHSYRVHPRSLFAVTFTNKAAAEMRSRVTELLAKMGLQLGSERELWVSTFHSSCVRILRSDIHHLGYSNHFTIYDDSDQFSVVKACLKELNIAENSVSPKAIQGRINRLKNDGIDFSTYKPSFGGMFEEAFTQCFEMYTRVLRKSSAVDFADLILLSVRLFQNHPQILSAYQDRFQYLMVDEYQDTNQCQYLLMKLLAKRDGNLCVVGDEDQSIYRWRGANIQNILNFEKDFPNAKVFKLEQNYRSSKRIIEAASHVISHNTERHDKRLWTSNPEGDKIALLECYDEHDEAQKVVQQVASEIQNGLSLSEMAIFYRTNAQSRVLEDMLRAKGYSYQIFGGLKFYDRLEVKDALAYAKLIANPADDVSFRRILNVPARGIGAVTLEKLVSASRQHGSSLLELVDAAYGKTPTLKLDLGRANRGLRQFQELMEALRRAYQTLLPSDLISAIIEETGYRKMLTDENSVESQSRLENLSELRQSVVEFELRRGAEDPTRPVTLEGFLEEIALVSDLDRFSEDTPTIKLMTIHMAKGLEFRFVQIVGLEEELFPNIRPWEAEDPADLEEERRLLYVGMTRAEQKLCLLFAKNRTVFGTRHFRVVSRFVDEIPREYLEEHRADFFERQVRQHDRPGLLRSWARGEDRQEPWESTEIADETDPFSQLPADEFLGESEIGKGTKVAHPLWGEGVVLKTLGPDKLVVEFPGRGQKRISLKFGQLKFL